MYKRQFLYPLCMKVCITLENISICLCITHSTLLDTGDHKSGNVVPYRRSSSLVSFAILLLLFLEIFLYFVSTVLVQHIMGHLLPLAKCILFPVLWHLTLQIFRASNRQVLKSMWTVPGSLKFPITTNFSVLPLQFSYCFVNIYGIGTARIWVVPPPAHFGSRTCLVRRRVLPYDFWRSMSTRCVSSV